MASIIPDSQLDNDIATIRSQIASLRHQKSLLSNTLLSSHKTHARLRRAKTTSPTPALSSALEITTKQSTTNTSTLYNSVAGITAFRVQDPDPNAVDNGRILGVRIDVFSPRKRGFETPYYLLLNQPEGKDGRLRVHKHTIPACVPLSSLIEKYLPFPKEGGGDALKGRKQDLAGFARAVRRECVALRKRLEALWGLKELGREQGVSDVRYLDGEGREVEIEFVDKHVAMVAVGTEGSIEKVVVRHGEKGGVSVRGKTIERMIMSRDGRVEGLVGRLREAGRR